MSGNQNSGNYCVLSKCEILVLKASHSKKVQVYLGLFWTSLLDLEQEKSDQHLDRIQI